MTTSTAYTIATNALTSLEGYFTAVLPVLVPIVIAVVVLFAGIFVLKGLWHRRV